MPDTRPGLTNVRAIAIASTCPLRTWLPCTPRSPPPC